jgi:RNA polymerase sigma-70 factor (ECF subfamily)
MLVGTSEVLQGLWVRALNADNDLELVQQCLAGDAVAMHRIYNRHAERLYALAARLTPRPCDAEDAVQETFVKAWRDLGRFRGEASLGTWLYRIALNVCRDLRKRRAIPLGETGLEADHSREAATDHSPRDVWSQAALGRAIAELPEGYREVLVLHDVQGLEHHEIAAMLQIAVGTSKSQLHKARALMRQRLQERGAA